jgi:adenylyl-sulfate kinase
MPPPLLDPPLLSPARLIAALRLDPKGRGMRAGREVLLVRARPREESTVRRGVLFELEFDAEHGLLLRRELFQEGRCVQLTEALTVRYDEPIDPGRFVFAPPDERSLHRSEDAHGTVESSTDGDGSDVSYADQPRSEEPRGLGAGATVWLTGLPGSGKTALGLALRGSFEKLGCQMCLLDGDALREGLSADLGMTPADRSEQARRAMHVAALVSGSGVVVVVALVSPYAADRLRARELHGRLGLRFYEVWVDTPLEICEQRDPKGFFARARSGSLRDLTGVDAPYEPPQTPEMRVSGCREPVERVAARIVELISPRNRPPAAGVA